MIQVVDLVQHYGVRPVLRGINLTIQTGELVVVLGANGMGKTTLLAAIAGVLSPQKGWVEIDADRRRQSPEIELAIRRRVAYLPDHPWLPSNMTGREFILAVGRLYDHSDDRLIEHTDRLLAVFELAREGDWPIRSYSNGQKKKIALCGALISEAPTLLLDEPFSGGLDPAGILSLKHILRRLVHDGRTIVMTTPVPELVEEMADRIVVLREGQVVAYDTADGLRRETGAIGPLGDVLGKLLHPKALEGVARYFERTPQ
jgi:ABC-type multidrug transport system ATPase subunit